MKNRHLMERLNAVRREKFLVGGNNICLFARMDILGVQTRLTFDVATPLETAVAAFGDAPSLSAVATPAAQLIAAVRAAWTALTLTAVSPGCSGHRGHLVDRVRLAVVRRRIDVDQIVSCWTTPANSWPAATTVAGVFPTVLLLRRPGGDGIQRCTMPVERHLASAVVTTPQPTADLPECWQLVPTGASAARSRHAVALARHLRMTVDRLSHRHHLIGVTNCRHGPNRKKATTIDLQPHSRSSLQFAPVSYFGSVVVIN